MFTRENLRNSSLLSALTAVGLAFLAWGGTQIYVEFCAPWGLTGFLQSLVTMDSTPCQALFAIISHTQTLYAATIGTLLFAFFSFLTSCIARAEPPPLRKL